MLEYFSIETLYGSLFYTRRNIGFLFHNKHKYDIIQVPNTAKESNNMQLEIVKKDITTISSDFLICHCISADAAMGAGVALALVRRFPSMKSEVKECLETIPFAQRVSQVVFFVDDISNTIVANMITKTHYWDKSSTMPQGAYLDNLRQCLILVKQVMLERNIKKLAMPKIGCGLDRCSWMEVESIILDVFDGTDIDITVCVL